MAKNNEFIVEVGAKLDKAQVKAMFEDLKKEIHSKDDITSIKIKVDTSNNKIKETARELQTLLQKEFKSMDVNLFSTAVKDLTNFEKRIGLLSNKLKNSGLNELTSDFNALETSLNRIVAGYHNLSNISDDNERWKEFERLKNAANGAEVKLDKLIKTERQQKAETAEAEKALSKYANELSKLNQLEAQLAKAKQKSKTAGSKTDVASMNAYVRELEKSVTAQKKQVDIAKQHATALNGADKVTKVFESSQRKLRTTLAGVNATQEQQLGLLGNIQAGFKDAISNLSGYALAFGTVQLAIQQIRQSIDTVIELDKAMVDLQIVTNTTRKEVHNLMQEYNQMAIDMGRSTKTVAESANEFLRMGYNTQEANELIKQSLTLSTLGMIDAAEATDYMISAMKGYGVEVENVSNIIDMATELDMKYSISSGYIMEAMSRTAASAKLAGSEMSNLMAMISIVGETTKKSPEVVGEAMKTMYARFGNVKINKFEDADNPDEVEGINDIERVLNRLGIAIRESGGEWRNYDEVMNEVGQRFNELTELEQNAVATAMFGTRQRENGLVILTNWNRVLEANEIALTAAGTSEERMKYYTEGLGAALERVGAAWERFLISLGDNQDIINIVNFLADVVELLSNPVIQKIILGALLAVGIEKIVSAIGNLTVRGNALLKSITGIIGAIKNGANATNALSIGITRYAGVMGEAGLVTAETSKAMMAGSKVAAGYALKLGKLALVSAVVYGVYKAVDFLNVTFDEQKEKVEEVSAEYKKLSDDVSNLENELTSTKKRLIELNNIKNPSFSDKKEIEELQATNAELERKIRLSKILESNALKKTVSESEVALEKLDLIDFEDEGFTDRIDKRKIAASVSNVKNAVETYYDKEISQAEALKHTYQMYQQHFNKANNEYEEAILSGKSEKDIEKLKKKKDETEEQLSDIESIYVSYMNNIEGIVGDIDYGHSDVIDAKKKELEELQDNYELITDDTDTSSKIISLKSQYSDLITSLYDYKDITSEVLGKEKYSEMVDAFKEIGMDIPDILEELGYGAEKVEDNKDNIKEYTDAMSSAVAGISDFASEISSIDDIISSLEGGNALSAENIAALVEKYPELTDELYEYLSGQKSEVDILNELKKIRKESIDDYIDQIQDAYKESSKYLTKVFNENKLLFNDLGLEYDANKNRFIISNIKMAEAAIKYAGVSQEAWMDAANSFLSLPWMSEETNQNGQDSVYISDGELYVHQHNNDGYHTEVNMGKAGAAIRKDSDASLKELENERKKIEDSITKTTKKETSESTDDPWKDAFDRYYNDLKHQLAMDLITEEDYYNKLEILNNNYFANKEKYIEQYDKYEEEVYKGRKQLWKDAYDEELDALDRLHERRIINDKQYLEEFTKLNDKYYKDNPLYKEEDLKNQDKIFELTEDAIKAEYEDWIAMHDDYVDEMDYYNKWSLQQKLNYLAEESAMMEKIYGENETIYEEYVNRQIELRRMMYDVTKEMLEEEVDKHDAYLEYVNDVIDKKVKDLEESKKALEEENDAREEAIRLAELEKKIAEAKRKKVLIYRKGQGFVYEQDQTAVNEAQKELDDYTYEKQKEKRIDAIQDEIDAWEEYRDKWNRTVEAYDEEQRRLTALMYDGYASEKEILKMRTDLIDKYAESYAEAANKVAEANKLINSNTYDMEYDPETGEFTSTINGDRYTGSYGSLYDEVQRTQKEIGTSGDTWAILPSGQKVKVNLNDKNKVTDSLPVGTTIVNQTGGWTITGGSAGAYESTEVKKPTSSGSSSGNKSSGGSNKSSGGSNKSSGGSSSSSSSTGYYGETKDSSGKTNQQKYLESLVSKGSSSSASATDKGNAEWAKQEIAAGRYASGTSGTDSDEIALVGEEGSELRILPKGTGVVPNPATETLMKFANNPASFINSLSTPNIASLSNSGYTEVFNVSGITVNANNAEEFINSLRTLKNKAIQRTSKRN